MKVLSAAEKIRRLAFLLLSFSSIALLLGHLYQVANFHTLGLWLGLPSLFALAGLWWWGRQSHDQDFLLRLKVGFIGGLWGTLAYDLVRIPLHWAGQNPFPPIRVYGMWLAGAHHSTPWTDLLGFAYHFSNGISFGWIYALLMLRRHWGWAIAWGLLLECLAIFTVFGDIFNIRYAPQAMVLAFVAHLFYGYPLGTACQNPERLLQKTVPVFSRARGWITVGLLGFCLVWFIAAWQPLGKQEPLDSGEIIIGPGALYPGCLDVKVGTNLRIHNTLGNEARLRLRRPDGLSGDGIEITIAAKAKSTVAIRNTGLHQIMFPESGWRSIVIFAHRDGMYRPEKKKTPSSNP